MSSRVSRAVTSRSQSTCGTVSAAREELREAVKEARAETDKELAADKAAAAKLAQADSADHAGVKADADGKAIEMDALSLESGNHTVEVTDAAGRAYLAKLAATADTACACTSKECGESVMQSWMTCRS